MAHGCIVIILLLDVHAFVDIHLGLCVVVLRFFHC